jgi:two-component system chemotaxis response regulator CheB
MLRVLVADDSPTTTTLLVEVLRSDPEIDVIGVARSGAEAVQLVEELRPHVITMDIQMPGMNGFDATKEIMIRTPTPVLIVSAHVDTQDVTQCMDAFRAGAVTLFPKLPDPDSPDFDNASSELLDLVKQVAKVPGFHHWRYAPYQGTPRGTQGDDWIRVVSVTMSSSSAPAIAELLGQLPEGFAAPILVVPHLGRGFTEGFVNWLSRNCLLTVKLAEDREALRAGTVYVAPENLHLGVGGTWKMPFAALWDGPPVHGFRPSANVLLESVAEVFGRSAVALVFPGTGENGLLGLCAVRLAGGRVIAQEQPKRPLRSGRPGAELAAGLADVVLPTELIAAQLIEVSGTGPNQTSTAGEGLLGYSDGGLRLADS